MHSSLPYVLGLILSPAIHGYTLNGQGKNFDYVVIGGGTAGVPVGTRLAEAGFEVAIVEAGGFHEEDEPILSMVPAFDFLPNPVDDWGFETVPQKGMNDRTLPYPRGKCLGGTSGRNAMIYQKGPRGAFQKWADEVNDQSYSLDNFDQYFHKSIQFTTPDNSIRPANATPGYDPAAMSSTTGPLSVTYPNWAVPISSWVRRAMSAVGIPDAGNFDDGKIMGSQYFKLTINPGTQERASSEGSYLQTFKDLPNLSVFTYTFAKRIIFDESKRATGVLVEIDGENYTLTASNEVILSAGAFQSPQLLMVSGIGPKELLQQYDIPIVVDNPNVGQGLSDHLWFGPAYRVQVETASRWNDDPIYLITQFENHQNNQSGPLTSNDGDFGAFEKVPDDLRQNFTASALADLATFPEDWPEIEYVVAPTFLGNFRSPQPQDGYQYASVAAALVAPLSRGNITISSADARVAPVINPNAFTSSTDRQVAVAAFKRLRQIFQAPEMAQVLVGDEYFPGSSVQNTDDEILEFLMDSSMVYYHAGGSCAMGDASKNDSKAVVDSRARMIGVQGLRIVDASVLPFLIPSHIQSAIYALGEKIADDIIISASISNLLKSQEL